MGQKIISSLKEKYFNNPNKIITIKKGNILMKQNQENKKLFLVLDGLVSGFSYGDGEKIEVFRSEEDMLVGLHSFFSRSFVSYSEVVALKDSRLTYLSYEDGMVRTDAFLEDFLPVIINGLFERQIFAKKLMLEKEQALIQNLHRDKLATLGQMAAGIAHELNNAIGVINSNVQWIAKEIHKYIKKTEPTEVFSNFDRGYDKGQYLSSSEVRKNKQNIEKQLNKSAKSAKKLAKLGFDAKDVTMLSSEKDIDELTDNMYYFWEMGVSIHDIILSSKHVANVISSVKSLGISEREKMNLNVNKTLEQALTIVQKQSEGIKIYFKTETLPDIEANETELVQIWVNLIKNACESLKNAETKKPEIIIKSENKKNKILVSITDNGPGIPKEVIDKIFQPDFTTKKGGLSFGLGLGLSVVQKHINKYKGTIDIESKPNKTTFCVKLPLE